MRHLTNKMIIGEKIGDWTASETPDGVIMWTKGKKNFWSKESTVAVMATPHYTKDNQVDVDVLPDMYLLEDNCLHTSFKLIGQDAKLDKGYYIARIENILSILK